MLATNNGDDECALAAALSLIDDVYEFHQLSTPTHDDVLAPQQRPMTAAVRRLRDRVATLEEALVVAKNTWRDGEMARAWAGISQSQREQHERALEENAVLMEAIHDQLSDVQRMALLLQTSVQLMRRSRIRIPYEPHFRQDVDYARYESIVRERLDAIDFANDPMWSCHPRPPIGPPLWDRSSQCDGHRLQICNRYRAFLPFKLSTIVDVVWEFINDRGSSDGIEPERNESSRRVSYLTDEPGGFYAMRGAGVCVRDYLPDGSVIFKWGITSSADHEETHNRESIMAGFLMHETGCIRATRVEIGGRNPLVYLEDIEWKVVEPEDDVGMDVPGQLTRIEAFFQWLSENYNLAAWQRLENSIVNANSAA